MRGRMLHRVTRTHAHTRAIVNGRVPRPSRVPFIESQCSSLFFRITILIAVKAPTDDLSERRFTGLLPIKLFRLNAPWYMRKCVLRVDIILNRE